MSPQAQAIMAALAQWPAHVPILEVLVLESGAINIRARGRGKLDPPHQGEAMNLRVVDEQIEEALWYGVTLARPRGTLSGTAGGVKWKS